MPKCRALQSRLGVGVNNKLAEIYFDKKKGGQAKIWAHCFVKKSEYRTKKEQKWIQEDTKRCRVEYRNKKHTLVRNKI